LLVAWLVERVIDPKKIDAEPDPMLRGQVLHTTLNRFYASLPRELDSERVTPENLEAAVALAHRCLDDALESGVRLDLTELQEVELRHTMRSDLEGFLRDEAASGVQFVPRRLEVAFGSERAAPELQRGLPLGENLWLSGKIDRIDIDPFSARGIVQDYKSGKGAHSARDIDRELRLQIPLYILALRDLVGVEPLGGVYRALAGPETHARDASRERPRGSSRVRQGRLPRRGDVLEPGRVRARASWGQRATHPGGRRAPRSQGRRLPGVVRPVADLQGGKGVTVMESATGLNDEQLAAVDAEGSVFVSAGAGTGKTSVLVERYVRAVCERASTSSRSS
jgi:ATP-dependent exoDNAse (exonuclease V) beta subunit